MIEVLAKPFCMIIDRLIDDYFLLAVLLDDVEVGDHPLVSIRVDHRDVLDRPVCDEVVRPSSRDCRGIVAGADAPRVRPRAPRVTGDVSEFDVLGSGAGGRALVAM